MKVMFEMDGTAADLTIFRKVYLALDVLVPLGAVHADILRHLQKGRGRGLSLAAHFARVFRDCKMTFPPPKELSFRDKYFLQFYG